jgi:acyl carrier protein
MIRKVITDAITELLKEEGVEAPTLNDDTILLSTELDSLGFAVLVVRLEEYLGYDPFTSMKEAIYPKTLKDLIEIYEQNKPE